jgi:hypothetical protein
MQSRIAGRSEPASPLRSDRAHQSLLSDTDLDRVGVAASGDDYARRCVYGAETQNFSAQIDFIAHLSSAVALLLLRSSNPRGLDRLVAESAPRDLSEYR